MLRVTFCLRECFFTTFFSESSRCVLLFLVMKQKPPSVCTMCFFQNLSELEFCMGLQQTLRVHAQELHPCNIDVDLPKAKQSMGNVYNQFIAPSFLSFCSAENILDLFQVWRACFWISTTPQCDMSSFHDPSGSWRESFREVSSMGGWVQTKVK